MNKNFYVPRHINVFPIILHTHTYTNTHTHRRKCILLFILTPLPPHTDINALGYTEEVFRVFSGLMPKTAEQKATAIILYFHTHTHINFFDKCVCVCVPQMDYI